MKFWNPDIMTHEHGTIKNRIVCDSKRLVETIMTDISVLDNVDRIKASLHTLYADLDAMHDDDDDAIVIIKNRVSKAV